MQWTAIARCLGVSSKTLYRRRLDYGLEDSYSDITNEELEWNIRDIGMLYISVCHEIA